METMQIKELALDTVDKRRTISKHGRPDTSWSDYVECSKYFSGFKGRSQSTPCMALGKKENTKSTASPVLSLAWQLAYSPATAATNRIAPSSELVPSKAGRASVQGERSKKLRQQSLGPNSRGSLNDNPKIVFVNGKVLRDYWSQKSGDMRSDENRGGKRKKATDELDMEAPPPKKTELKIKNPYAVPLCYRLTSIMGPKSRQEQQQLQLQQQRQQQQQQQLQVQLQMQLRNAKPLQHVARRAQHQIAHCPKYAVPMESLYSNPRKGSRYCGNFYYS